MYVPTGHAVQGPEPTAVISSCVEAYPASQEQNPAPAPECECAGHAVHAADPDASL